MIKKTSFCRYILLFFLCSQRMQLAALETETSSVADNSVATFMADIETYEHLSDDHRRTEMANSLMHQLADFIGEDIRFTTATHPDSMSMNIYYWAAEYLYDNQHFDSALRYARMAYPLTHNNRQLHADCTNLLAIINLRLGNTQEAATYGRQCYEMDLQSGNPDNISSSLNTLAAIYISANMAQEAEQYVLKGIEYSREAGNASRLATLQGMASEVYHALGNHEKALSYGRTAYDMEQSLQRPSQAAIRLSEMAAALIGLHRFAEAKACLLKAIPQFEADGNWHSLGISCNKMGELLKWEQKLDSAASYYARGAEIFQQLGDIYNEVHSQLGLYNSLKDSDPQEAMRHMERHNQLKDSIYSRDAAQAIGRLNAKLGNARILAEKDAAHASATRTKRYLYIGIAIAVLLALVVVILLWQLRHRTRRFEQQFNDLNADISDLPDITASPQFSPNVTEPSDATSDAVSPTDAEFIAKVDAIVLQQIARGHVDVSSIAQELCMSTTTFRRRFTSAVDEKPLAYVMRLRMNEARRLMDECPELNITEVGMRMGFDDKSNFTRAFKRIVGITPSEYKSRQTEKLTAGGDS